MIAAILIVFLPLLLVEAFFSASEISLISSSYRRLRHRAEQGQAGAKLAIRLLDRPERMVATCLLGSNLAQISNTILVTALLLQWFGPSGEIIAMLLLPPLILLLAEIIPKSIGRQRPNRLAQRLAPALWLITWIMYPLTVVFATLSRIFLFLTGARKTSELPFITREDLHLVVQKSGPEVELEAGERRIINRILRFSLRTVKEVMVPLIRVAAIPDTLTVAQVLEEFRTTPFARLPVYHRRIDNLVGVVHGFDLLGETPSAKSLKPFIRSVQYVPEIKKIDHLLTEMQRTGTHLAVVVDEYGGATGIVTIEDLLEEIVGEIADEFDQEVSPYMKLGDGHYLIDARMEIGHLNEILQLEIPPGDYETLAGFIISQLGELPRAGEHLQYGNFRFIIRRAEARAIKEVELFVHHAAD